MGGGSAEAVAAAEPVSQAYAARMVHIGGPGAGQTTKMVNQIAIAGVVQGLSEALRFAQASKLDTDKIFEAVSGGAAASRSEEHTSELQSLMRNSYAVFCLKKNKTSPA